MNPTHRQILRNAYDRLGPDGFTPRNFLDVSRDPESESHDMFEWDDAVAAEKHRLDQSGRYIQYARHNIITPEQKVIEVRDYLSVKEDRDGEATNYLYVAIEDLTPRQQEIILNQMRRDIAIMKRRYANHLAAFRQLFGEAFGEEWSA